MKKILLFCIFLFCCSGVAFADTKVILTWDPGTETDLAGYRVYQSGVSDGQVRLSDGGSPVVTRYVSDPDPVRVSVIVPDGTWYWKVTAFDTSNNESVFSNEALFTTLDTTAPGEPGGFRIESSVVVP